MTNRSSLYPTWQIALTTREEPHYSSTMQFLNVSQISAQEQGPPCCYTCRKTSGCSPCMKQFVSLCEVTSGSGGMVEICWIITRTPEQDIKLGRRCWCPGSKDQIRWRRALFVSSGCVVVWAGCERFEHVWTMVSLTCGHFFCLRSFSLHLTSLHFISLSSWTRLFV